MREHHVSTDKLNDLISSKLMPFMRRFENDNLGNRLSPDIIQGLGGFLHKLIYELIQEGLKEQQAKSEDTPH